MMELRRREMMVERTPHDYSLDMLTLTAIEDCVFYINEYDGLGGQLFYSIDNGTTWTEILPLDQQGVHSGAGGIEFVSPTVTAGNKLLLKGSLVLGDTNGDGLCIWCGNNYKVSGNILSVMDETLQRTSMPAHAFRNLFNYQNTFSGGESTAGSNKLISAKNLILPSFCSSYCYSNMFYYCNVLQDAPALPAMTLSTYCYNYMFYYCQALTTAPELPATTLANGCCQYMFYGCRTLTAAPDLPALTLPFKAYYYMFYGCNALKEAANIAAVNITGNQCCQHMFRSCTGLLTAKVPPATQLTGTNCYHSMYYGCTNLVNVPSYLPATKLSSGCYNEMFRGCSKLTTVPSGFLPVTSFGSATHIYKSMFYQCTRLTSPPALPCTTLTTQCYAAMFYGCSYLTTAPDLPALTLATGCYLNMFNSCTRLQYVKAMFTTTPSDTYTQTWLQSVKSTGTFVKNVNATWTNTGVNAVPTNWTIQTATP